MANMAGPNYSAVVVTVKNGYHCQSAELTYGSDISDGKKWQLQPKQLALFLWLAQGHYMCQ